MSKIWSPFRPHTMVRGGGAQTIVGHLFGRFEAAGLTAEPMTVELADGDRLIFHIDYPVKARSNGGLVLLLHGLGGCSESLYNMRIASKLIQEGFTVVRFNHRGCGRGADGLARQIYHSGVTSDVLAAAQAVARRWPDHPLGVVGFSLSGNTLLAMLGKEVASVRAIRTLRGALAVCPPVDLEACSLAIGRMGNLIFDQYYVRRLVRTAHKRVSLFPELGTPKFPRLLNIREFDEIYTAPHGGFKDRAEYYATSSAKDHLSRIEVPTIILAAKDDPIIPGYSFDGARLGSSVELSMQEGGGHLGFISGKVTRHGDYRWMDEAVLQWAGQMVV